MKAGLASFIQSGKKKFHPLESAEEMEEIDFLAIIHYDVRKLDFFKIILCTFN